MVAVSSDVSYQTVYRLRPQMFRKHVELQSQHISRLCIRADQPVRSDILVLIGFSCL